MLRHLDDELGRLPDKYRAAIVLCDLEARSIAEAARQLHCPQGTLASRLSRGRALLAKRLAARGVELYCGTLATAIAGQTADAMPQALMSETIEAASALAAGKAIAAANVAALMKGVLTTMLFSKTKIIAGALLLTAAIGGGAFAPMLLSQSPGEEKGATSVVPTRSVRVKSGELLKLASREIDGITDEVEKAYSLAQLAIGQARNGQRPLAVMSFARSFAAAKAINCNDAKQTASLKYRVARLVAFSQAEAGMAECAWQTALTFDAGDEQRQWAFCGIATILARNGDIKGAIETTEFDTGEWKFLALLHVVGPMVAAGNKERALELSLSKGNDREYNKEYKRVLLLTNIAIACSRAGKRDDAKKVIELAMPTAEALSEESTKQSALQDIANAQDEIGDEAGARRTAERIRNSPECFKEFVFTSAFFRARKGMIAEAQKAVDATDEQYRKDALLREIAGAQARTANFTGARQTIGRIHADKCLALGDLALARLRAGDRVASASLFREALASKEISDRYYLDGDPLKDIVIHWTEGGGQDDALAWVNEQQSPFVKAVALAGIAEGIAKRRDRNNNAAGQGVP